MLVWVDNAQPLSTRSDNGHASHPRGGARAVLPPAIAVPGLHRVRGNQMAGRLWRRHRTNRFTPCVSGVEFRGVFSGRRSDRRDPLDPCGVSESNKESKSRKSCGVGVVPIAALSRS